MVEWLGVESCFRTRVGISGDYKTLCQPGIKCIPVSNQGRSTYGDGRAPPFIRCAKDKVGY